MTMMDSPFGGSPMSGGYVKSVTPLYQTGMPSAAGGTNLSGLIQSLQQSSQQANTDSLKQYKALLASVAGTKNQVMGQFDQLGQNQMQQINQQGQQAMGQANTSAIARGLGNTTILDSMRNGVARNTQMEKTNLSSNLAAQKANFGMQMGQMQGDAILSRQNQGPDIGTYLNMIMQLARSGNGLT